MTAFLLLGTAASALAAGELSDPIEVAQFSSGQIGEESDFDSFDDEYDEYQTVADPLYYWNKTWFVFNDGLYHALFKPLATGYAWLIPERPRTWVSNFFINMLFPVRFINNVLTGKFDAAYMEVSKFIANTAFGLGGLGDVTADRPHNWEPERPTADGFGQTLGKAGFGHGVYLVWPFLGPSSIRESVGFVGDYFCDPLTYADLTFLEMVAVRAYKNVNALSLELEDNNYETLTEGAVDKYAAVRDAYIRYRAKKVAE
ncbi:MAG: VacJ family lipoprotein [Desulfovibrionaceae bacterium]|nr:VacJ family lipoprotein [Desulfovibrionaceae bacterium]